ncbi:hypothetical protein HPB51_002428 [Rhipicephalus microplus]|uniref:Ig-like domain-containing protein n=1 Tax=Rhipicephalus microplus TaxID=6941 RepID=A0A9J6DSR5_RHIMP|nr:hypothetical protein HPB51_002428 [Rhipicephalus microplus]
MPIPCGRYHTSPHSVGTAHLCSHRNVLGLLDRVEYLSASALEFALPPYSAPLQEPGKGEPHSLLPPRMAEYRGSVRVEKGERAVLPCLAQGHPPPKHRWFRISSAEDQQEAVGPGASDGVESALPVMLSDTVILLPGGPLLLHTAGTQDNGRYLCVANNSAGEDRAHTDLLVTVPLSARIDPSVQVVDVGRSANLSCHVAGHPVHGVVWTHNGRTITPSYTIAVLSRDTLHITGVNRQDRGMYQCLVYNERDSAQGSAQLVIGEDAPVFEHVFTERQARPGTTVSLRCSASGNPLPQVTWSLDGAPVPEHYHVRIGDYVSGERLNVLGKPLIRPMANVTALAGRTMKLHCAVAGHPIKNIVWQKDGRSLPQNHRQHSFPNGSLVVAEVQRSVDSGWYACVAKDSQGNTARGQLAVHVMTGSDGGRQFSVIISNANIQILENGSLSIREADTTDAAHYMCQALNGVGPGISTVVKLDVHDKTFADYTAESLRALALTSVFSSEVSLPGNLTSSPDLSSPLLG